MMVIQSPLITRFPLMWPPFLLHQLWHLNLPAVLNLKLLEGPPQVLNNQ